MLRSPWPPPTAWNEHILLNGEPCLIRHWSRRTIHSPFGDAVEIDDCDMFPISPHPPCSASSDPIRNPCCTPRKRRSKAVTRHWTTPHQKQRGEEGRGEEQVVQAGHRRASKGRKERKVRGSSKMHRPCEGQGRTPDRNRIAKKPMHRKESLPKPMKRRATKKTGEPTDVAESGSLIRMYFNSRREDVFTFSKRKKAACCIQRAWRSSRRKRIPPFCDRAQTLDTKSAENAAIIIQRAMRWVASRRQADREEEAKAVRSMAAAIIQRAFRCSVAVAELARRRRHASLSDSPPPPRSPQHTIPNFA
eukprot:Sspe_Gene.57123::Locus_31363_Transcript_1_3_Confidence_0.400_Length_3048::g.57123::m.57123